MWQHKGFGTPKKERYPEFRLIAIRGLEVTPGIDSAEVATELIDNSKYYGCVFEYSDGNVLTKKVLTGKEEVTEKEFHSTVVVALSEAREESLKSKDYFFYAIANSEDNTLVYNTEPRISKLSFHKMMRRGRRF